MTRIGLLSDTHGLLDERIFEHFQDVDEIWHAGDIGAIEVMLRLREFKPLRAVRGNADYGDVRYLLRDVEAFRIEHVNVLMTHIGFQHGYLTHEVRRIVEQSPVGLFVSGHSHILNVHFDRPHNMLCLNPGAAGKYGIQTVQTLLRFCIDGDKVTDLEVIELHKN